MADSGGRKKQRFAMVPEELILRAPDEHCLRIYAYLDLRQGAKGWPVRGIGKIGRDLGLARQTIAKHIAHLEERRWVRADREPGSKKKLVVRVIHNPARSRWEDEADELPERPPRHRAPSLMTGPESPAGDRPSPRVDDSADDPVGHSTCSPDEHLDAHDTNMSEPDCGSADEPQSLSTRSGSGLEEDDPSTRLCQRCHDAPIAYLVMLDGGRELQLCRAHAESDPSFVGRLLEVDVADWRTFPTAPFAPEPPSDGTAEEEALALIMDAFPGAELIEERHAWTDSG